MHGAPSWGCCWRGALHSEPSGSSSYLAGEGPSAVLSFELDFMKSDVECTSTRKADYGPVEGKLHEGFYAFRVETVSSDGGCARTYWDHSQGEPPEDLGTSREERLYRWDGSGYR